MIFEFDPVKSAANKTKHGLDFDEAQALWRDPFLVELDARLDGERRWLAIGRIGQKHWAAVYVYRLAVIRLISVRRARRGEVDVYEGGRV